MVPEAGCGILSSFLIKGNASLVNFLVIFLSFYIRCIQSGRVMMSQAGRQAEMGSSCYLYKGNTIQRMRSCGAAAAAAGGEWATKARVSVCEMGKSLHEALKQLLVFLEWSEEPLSNRCLSVLFIWLFFLVHSQMFGSQKTFHHVPYWYNFSVDLIRIMTLCQCAA